MRACRLGPGGTTYAEVTERRTTKAERRAQRLAVRADINLALGVAALPDVHVEFPRRQRVVPGQRLRANPTRTAARKATAAERRTWLASIAGLHAASGARCYQPFTPVKAVGVSSQVRAIVHLRATRDGRRCCERCAQDLTRGGGQVHHRRPRGAGSSVAADTNLPSNLLYLCGSCHAGVESYRQVSHDHGWLVHQGHKPGTLRVQIDAGTRWVWLTDDGGYIDCDLPEES